MHILASIVCLLMAVVLGGVVVDDWATSPGWVSGLTLLTTAVLVASAVRVYMNGARRKHTAEGPRTKIVIADVTTPPPRSRGTRR